MGLEIPFCVETSVFGEIQEVDLKPDGSTIFVNDANKVRSDVLKSLFIKHENVF